ncbi:MAG: hypothetical protein ACREGC_00545, partial [Minisyncoccia bacterium]
HGPFASFYHGLAGIPIVDWLFMLGLLFVGLTLTLGVFVKLGSLAGFAMLLLMYTAVGIPPTTHPFIDDHFIEMLIMIGLMLANSDYLGFGGSWSRSSIVQRMRLLK